MPNSTKVQARTAATANPYAEREIWAEALQSDPHVNPTMFAVGWRIAKHVYIDKKTKSVYDRDGIIDDETLVDEIGLDRCTIWRARLGLRKLGWLTWRRRPNQANVYRLLPHRINAILDQQIQKRERRKAAKAGRQTAQKRHRTPKPVVAPVQLPDVAPVLHDLVTGLSLEERTSSKQRLSVVEREPDAAAFGFGPAPDPAALTDDEPPLTIPGRWPPGLPERRDEGGDVADDWFARLAPNPPPRQWWAQAAE